MSGSLLMSSSSVASTDGPALSGLATGDEKRGKGEATSLAYGLEDAPSS